MWGGVGERRESGGLQAMCFCWHAARMEEGILRFIWARDIRLKKARDKRKRAKGKGDREVQKMRRRTPCGRLKQRPGGSLCVSWMPLRSFFAMSFSTFLFRCPYFTARILKRRSRPRPPNSDPH